MLRLLCWLCTIRSGTCGNRNALSEAQLSQERGVKFTPQTVSYKMKFHASLQHVDQHRAHRRGWVVVLPVL